jgi:hypothetical protein
MLDIKGALNKVLPPKAAKVGGLIDSIKKGAEAGLAAAAKDLGKEANAGASLQKIASDADTTTRAKSPSATSRLDLHKSKQVGHMAAEALDSTAENIAIGYRTKISAAGNGELTSI